jgi:MraZ protein
VGLSGYFWVFREQRGAALFRGGSTVNLDAKGRLALPTRYRAELQDRCEGRLVVTVHDDRCLMMYPQPDWDEIERKLIRLPNQNKRTRTLQRMVLGHATELELDRNGRLLLPPRLREFASLGKRVVLVGLGNKFEIWNEEAWEKDCTDWVASNGDETDMPDSLETLTL